MPKRNSLLLTMLLMLSLATLGIKPDRIYRFYPEKLGLIYKDLSVTTPDKLKIKTWFYPAQHALTQEEMDKAWNNPVKRSYATLDNT